MSRRHWEAWLDTRVPALGNKTPRQAARTASGRERLEALLAEFDRHTTDGPSSVTAPVVWNPTRPSRESDNSSRLLAWRPKLRR